MLQVHLVGKEKNYVNKCGKIHKKTFKKLLLLLQEAGEENNERIKRPSRMHLLSNDYQFRYLPH